MSHEAEQPLHTSPTPTVPPTRQLTSKPLLLIPESTAPLQTLLFHAHKYTTSALDDDDGIYFGRLPPGYKFVPTDDELIVHYLSRKIQNFPLPRNKITDVKLYEHNPQLLSEKYEYCEDANNDKRWYFFTPRERKYKNGSRPNRAAGNGYWKATGADKQIKYKGQLVGFRKSLVFYLGKPPRGEKTNWIMYEYRVSDPPKPTIGSHDDMKLDDWVLCRVHEKEGKNAATNQQEDEGNSGCNMAVDEGNSGCSMAVDEGNSGCNMAVDDGESYNNERNDRLMLADQHLPLPLPLPGHPYPYDPSLLNCPFPSPFYYGNNAEVSFGNNAEDLNDESLNFGNLMPNTLPLRPFSRFNHDELLYKFDEIDPFMNVPVAAFPSDNVQSDNAQLDNVQHTRTYTTPENSDKNAPPKID